MEIPVSLTPLQALERQAQSRPESTAFIFHEDVWTYRRLADESERIAQGFAVNHVKPGDRVVLHMLNRPEMIVTYYACYRLGAIVAPLRSAFTSAELESLFQRLQPALYIGETSLYPNVALTNALILPASHQILIDDHAGTYDVQSWDFLKQAGPAGLPMPSISEPAVLINTSGTTSGRSKFVVHTPSTMAAIAELICKNDGLSNGDISVSPLALTHASGIFRSLAFIQLGVPFVILESFDANAVLDNIERYRGTYLFGPPAHYAALLQAQQAKPRDLASLRFGTVGGDGCPIDLQEKATSILGVPLYNYWATTESVGSLTFALRPGAVSRIVEGAQIRLIDSQGAEVPHGEVGELIICGPNVFTGYWDDPTATAQNLRDGWYHTGDMMRQGNGDEIWYVARKKDIIIRSGTNISPIEVEEALIASHPAVKEAVVVGKPDPVFGQRVFAFVTLTPGAKTSAVSDILDQVRQKLATFKVPEDIVVLDELPRNALNKVDRMKLQTILCA
jgi:long-chain acyl-CoA synthetase